MTLITRNGNLVSGLFGLRQRSVPVRGASTSTADLRFDGESWWLDVVVTSPASGATSHQVTVVKDGAVIGSQHIGLSGAVGPLPDGTGLMIYQITPNGGLAEQGSVTQGSSDTEITITQEPSLSFNGGEVVGATLTVNPVGYTGGPVTDPIVYTLYTSNDSFVANRVEYAVYTEPLAVPAEWEGLKVRVEVPLIAALGTETGISDASAVITDDEALPVPPQPIEQDWSVASVEAPAPNAATHFVTQYDLSGGAAASAVAVQWLNSTLPDFEAPETYEHLWNNCELNGGLWWHLDGAGAYKIRVIGEIENHLRMRYKLDADGPWSATSVDKKQGVGAPQEPPATQAMWHTVGLVTDQEAAAGRNAGSAGQPPHLCVRAEGDPSVIVFFCDINGIFRSEDDGVTFRRPAQKGLFAPFSLTGAIDPTDDRVIFYAGCSKFYPEGASRIGMFRSTDAGETFSQVLVKTDMEQYRQTRSYFMDYDRSKRTTQTPNNRTWLAVLPDSPNNVFGNWRLYRSDTGGQSWGSPIFTFTQATHGNINYLVSHPSVAGCFYIGANKGLWRTTNYGASWTNLTTNLVGWNSETTNRVMGVEINPLAGSIATTELYVSVGNLGTSNTGATGVHRSTDGGGSFAKLTTPGNPSILRVARNSSGQWAAVGSRVMYLIGRSTQPRRTVDGGANWTTVTVNGRPYANGTLGGLLWDSSNSNFTYAEILPHPTNPNVVWGHGLSYLFRSTNGGTIFNPTGAWVEMANWQTGWNALAFCEGNITGAENRALIGTTDFGLYITDNAGRSWHFTKINYDQTNGVKEDSVNMAAQCPDDLDFIIATTGYHNSTSAWMRTSTALPNNFASGDWTYTGRTDSYPHSGHWHKSDPTICYTSFGRFTNAKVNNNFSAYSGGGYLVAVAPQNNDIVFKITGTGAGQTAAIQKSTDKGATWSAFVTPGWNPARDSRKAMVAVDPGDANILYMPGPMQSLNKDLRRYNGNTSTWKTDYGLPARVRSDNPTYPSNMPVMVDRIAVDPQDRDTLAVSIYALSFCEVYITYNATAATPTWERITKNLSRINAPGLRFHPTNGDLWCGFTYGGAFVYPHPDAHPDPTWTTNLIVQNVETEL